MGGADPANLDASISVDDEVEGCDRHGEDPEYERTRLLRAAREAVAGNLEAYYAKGSKWWDKSDEIDDFRERPRNESELVQQIAGVGAGAGGASEPPERHLEKQPSAGVDSDVMTQEEIDKREAIAGEMDDDCHLQRVPLKNTHSTAGASHKGRRRSSILHMPTVLANSRKMGSAYESAAKWAAERVLYMEKRGVLTPFEAQLLLHEIAVPNSSVIKLCTSGKAVAILGEVNHLNEEHHAEHALMGDRRGGPKRPGSSRDLLRGPGGPAASGAASLFGTVSDGSDGGAKRRGSDVMIQRGTGGGSALHPGLARKTSIPLLATMKDVTPTVDSPHTGVGRKSSDFSFDSKVQVQPGRGSSEATAANTNMPAANMPASILKDTSARDLARAQRTDSSLSDESFALNGHASPVENDAAAEGDEGAGDGKKVAFSMVQIRYFSYRVGQGVPSDGGPAIGLSWHYSDTLTDTLTIDEAEDIAESSNRLSARDFGCKGYLRYIHASGVSTFRRVVVGGGPVWWGGGVGGSYPQAEYGELGPSARVD